MNNDTSHHQMTTLTVAPIPITPLVFGAGALVRLGLWIGGAYSTPSTN